MNKLNAVIIVIFVGILGFLGGLFYAKWQEVVKPKRQVIHRLYTMPALATVVKRVEPIYPPSAMKDGVEGSVGVMIKVGMDGSPMSTSIMRSVRPDIDSAALAAVRLWKFSPTGTMAVVSLDFKLEAQKPSAR